MSLRADIEALAAMDRGSAGPGERASAGWCAARLRQAGAVDVRIEPFTYQATFGYVHAAHFAAATIGRVPAMGALFLFLLDYSGRAQPLRRLLPRGEGANVIARVPAGGERKRTLVLVAHHDAANTGLMWHPRVAPPARAHGVTPFSLGPELAMLAIALGPRRLRAPARAVLAGVVALSLEVARGPTVPGASDNASGVASVLALAERFVGDPLPGTEVIVVLPGAEESGMGGMAAWLRGALPSLDPGATLVLSLDTLGAGEPMVASAEGPLLWPVRYHDEDLALADAGARRAGLDPPRRFRVGGWTDPALASLAGLRALSVLSLRGNAFNDYHLSSDTPENVDFECAERCTALAEATAREFAGR
ncbi:MAG: M28 family peptidase [Thermoleophilaceae bacterium]